LTLVASIFTANGDYAPTSSLVRHRKKSEKATITVEERNNQHKSKRQKRVIEINSSDEAANGFVGFYSALKSLF
jgi:hypothetical protein